MSKLVYKTRDEENPRGKPRVYFCCHPDDFELYFSKISLEILKRGNYAIWYNEKPHEEYDELFFMVYWLCVHPIM